MVRQPRPNKHHARSNAGCSADVQGGERDVRQMRHPLCGMCVRKVRGMAGEAHDTGRPCHRSLDVLYPSRTEAVVPELS